jgi:hypothetical protein
MACGAAASSEWLTVLLSQEAEGFFFKKIIFTNQI